MIGKRLLDSYKIVGIEKGTTISIKFHEKNTAGQNTRIQFYNYLVTETGQRYSVSPGAPVDAGDFYFQIYLVHSGDSGGQPIDWRGSYVLEPGVHQICIESLNN